KYGECKTCIILCISKNRVQNDSIYTPKTTTNYSNVTRPEKDASLDMNMMTPENVSISPNPSQNGWKVNLKTLSKGGVSVKLFDLNGKTLRTDQKQVEAGSSAFYLNGKNLRAGVYIRSEERRVGKQGVYLIRTL